MTRKRWSNKDAAQLRIMHDEKLPWSTIAAYFGVSVRACEKMWVRMRAAEKRAASGEGPKRKPGGQPKPPREPKQKQAPPWSAAEVAELTRRGDAGESMEAIAIAIGRSAAACHLRYKAIRRTTPRAPDAPPPKRPTERDKADAAQRASLAAGRHASLTSAFCGDPLPGRSALDRLRAGIIDEPDTSDHRTAYYAHAAKITLAGETTR